VLLVDVPTSFARTNVDKLAQPFNAQCLQCSLSNKHGVEWKWCHSCSRCAAQQTWQTAANDGRGKGWEWETACVAAGSCLTTWRGLDACISR
jgi:hypothetical protein